MPLYFRKETKRPKEPRSNAPIVTSSDSPLRTPNLPKPQRSNTPIKTSSSYTKPKVVSNGLMTSVSLQTNPTLKTRGV